MTARNLLAALPRRRPFVRRRRLVGLAEPLASSYAAGSAMGAAVSSDPSWNAPRRGVTSLPLGLRAGDAGDVRSEGRG